MGIIGTCLNLATSFLYICYSFSSESQEAPRFFNQFNAAVLNAHELLKRVFHSLGRYNH